MRPHRNTIHSGSVLFASLATLVCPLAFVAAASSEPAPGAAAPWISPRLLAASLNPAEASAIERRPTGASPFVALFVRGSFDRAEARARGVAIGARAGDWTTARLPLERLEALASLPGVKRSCSRTAAPWPSIRPWPTRASRRFASRGPTAFSDRPARAS